jgi:hypothetical protein
LREGDICTAFSGHKSASRKTLGIVSGGVKKLISQTVPWLPQESLFLFGWKGLNGRDVSPYGGVMLHPLATPHSTSRVLQGMTGIGTINQFMMETWKRSGRVHMSRAKDGKCIFERI